MSRSSTVGTEITLSIEIWLMARRDGVRDGVRNTAGTRTDQKNRRNVMRSCTMKKGKKGRTGRKGRR